MSRGWETPMRSSSETGAGVTGVAGRLNALSLQSGAARGRPGARVAGSKGCQSGGSRFGAWKGDGRRPASRGRLEMMSHWRVQLRPGVALREIVQQATASLLAMDAERLEELARCCADLNRDLQQNGQIAEVAAELQRARSEMELLRRILYETRANFMVISRLQAIRVRNAGQMTGNGARVGGWSGSGREADYGDN